MNTDEGLTAGSDAALSPRGVRIAVSLWLVAVAASALGTILWVGQGSRTKPRLMPRRQGGVTRRPSALLALLLVFASACTQGTVPPADVGLAIADIPRTAASPADAAAAGAAINDFGFDLYRLAVGPDGDIIVSPASIVLALAMARAGARGETATQIDAVLHDVASDMNAGWLNALDAALASRTGSFRDAAGKDMDVLLRIANAPFAQDGMPLARAYLEALASRFGAGVRLVDYMTATEAARKAINGWVNDETESRIPELLLPGDLDAMTRLVLVNAIYLKAAWLNPFAETLTAPGPFTRLDGSIVDVPMMSSVAGLPYAAGDGWRAVELPYVGDSLAMTIIVPEDLGTFEASLDAEAFARITSALEQRMVTLSFPKFGLETRTELGPVLSALGMPLAFDPANADFSGITAAERLYIAAVIHQANIDVDEKGTEAAAATAVIMRTTGAPGGDAVTLRVDRPFLFALRDVPTGAILFLGRVTEPEVRS